ncbi:MoaD/ThiS family protein [Actinomycetota bacterium]
MTTSPATSQTSGPGAEQGVPTVQVRYWAGARAAAGVEEDTVSGATVADALEAATALRPGLAAVLPACSFLVDGHRREADTALAEGSRLEVLPPFAGG